MPRIDRPRVILTSTMSVDGRITVGPGELLLDPRVAEQWGELHPSSTASVIAARTALLERHGAGVVLEGSGTFVRHGMEPNHLPPDDATEDLFVDFLPTEIAGRAEYTRWFAVVDSRGRCRWDFTGSGDTDLLVLASRSTPRQYLAYLRQERICYLVVGIDRVDLPLAIARLGELRSTCVVADGGGCLNAALFDADLVDEVQIVILPAVIGGRDTPSLVDGPQPLAPPRKLSFRSARTESDGVIWSSYDVVRDDPVASSVPDTVPVHGH